VAAPFQKQVKVLLEKDCEFQIGIRKGKVLELREEGYFTFLEEWTDPDTGAWHESNAAVLSYKMIVTENNYGKLKILKRPLAKPVDPSKVRRSERVLVEINRMLFRKQYVLAIQGMLDGGELQLTRDNFSENIVAIVANGTKGHNEYLAAVSIRQAKRGGAKVKKTKLENERAIEFHQGFKSGHTMWKWYWSWRIDGDDGLFDGYRNCGKYKRYDDATDAFACKVLDTLWDQEHPTIKSCVESVQAAIDAENDR
jgi:putative transposase